MQLFFMLKRLSILFLCLLFALRCSASQDFISHYGGKKFEIIIPSEILRGETNHLKSLQLLILLRHIEKEYFSDGDYLKIQFVSPNNNFSSRFLQPKRDYFVGYENLEFCHLQTQDKLLPRCHRKAISIFVSTENLNIEDCLKIIYYAINNKHTIESNQLPYLLYHRCLPEYLVNTIPKLDIDKVLISSNVTVNELTKFKFYKSWVKSPIEKFQKLSYYIQHDSAFVYRKNLYASDTAIEKIANGEEILEDTSKSYLFAFSNIISIHSDCNGNYIIFTDWETFYHINDSNSTCLGPKKFPFIDSVCDKGIKIPDSIYNKGDSIIITTYTSYGSYAVVYNTKRKSILIDTSSFTNGITDRLKKIKGRNNTHETKIKQNESFAMRKYYTLILVCFVIVLNLFLAFSKKL